RQVFILQLHSADSPSWRELVIDANACVECEAPFWSRIEIHLIVGAGPSHAAENAGIGSPVLETSAVSRASDRRDELLSQKLTAGVLGRSDELPGIKMARCIFDGATAEVSSFKIR